MSGLEHLVFCIDNSAWSRNGDYRPTRLDAQLDMIYDFYSKFLDVNPENTMGIITMGGNSVTVRTSLTRERFKLGTAMKLLEIRGKCDLYKGLAMAQLVLKHRENPHGNPRIVAFVGSPLENDLRLNRLAMMLSKDGISVDILAFGEIESNRELLSDFIAKVNVDNNSHVYEILPNQNFKDVLMQSFNQEAFAGEEEMDPELKRALEESLRTYQNETGQTVNQEQAMEQEGDGHDALKETYEEDLDDEYMQELNKALMMSMMESESHDKQEDPK